MGEMAAHVRGAQQAVVELERERGEGALANVGESDGASAPAS